MADNIWNKPPAAAGGDGLTHLTDPIVIGNNLQLNNGVNVSLGGTSVVNSMISSNKTGGRRHFALTPGSDHNRVLMVMDSAHLAVALGIALQSHPLTATRSSNSPATNPDEWMGMQHNGSHGTMLNKTGAFIFDCATALPLDGALANNQVAFAFIAGGPSLDWKHKDGSGTVRTGSIALA